MNPIGGFFELELRKGKEFHADLLALNTGRNALEYILKMNQYSKIYIPYYTCDVILEPIKKLNVEYAFYSINEKLEIAQPIELKEREAILVTNYFGLKDSYIKTLCKSVRNLIVDNSQSFFSGPVESTCTFYSCRKFFGVPDGAYVKLKSTIQDIDISETDNSAGRFSHLIKRIDQGAENAYPEFKANDLSLSNQRILRMSNLTKALMQSIDYNSVRKIRNENFNYLHSILNSSNELDFFQTDSVDGPMVYPYLVRKQGLKEKLISNKIFTATYWPNVGEWCKEECVEKVLFNNLIALPVDQRYSIADMKQIIQFIQE